MLSRFRFLAFCCLCFVFLAGCLAITNAPEPGGAKLTGAEAILARAEKAYAQADYLQASHLYDQYLAQSQASPRLEAILASAGLAAEKSVRLREAIGHYQKLRATFPQSAYAKQVGLRLPNLYLAAGQSAQAAALAAELLPRDKDPKNRAEFNLVLGRANWSMGRYPEAYDFFIKARDLGVAIQKTQAEAGILGSLAQISQPELAEVVRARGQSYPGPEAAFYMALQSAKMGDLVTFEAQNQYFRRYFPNHPWVALLDDLANNPQAARDFKAPGADYSPKPDLALAPALVAGGLTSGGTAPPLTGQKTIAAILPLTGDPGSKFAREVLAGLKLALTNSGVRLGVWELDTHGQSGLAAKLVSEAAGNPDVLAVVGPLTSREALAVAQMAQQVAIPTLTISTRLGLTNDRPWVFRIFLTVKRQAEVVARYAIQTLEKPNLAILYPNDPYGQAMLGFFRAEATRLGATIVKEESYAPKSDDWSAAVARLTGGQSVRRASASYQAQIPFTALFLPDSAPMVSQILAQMAYHDVTKMTYLGTSMWLTPDLPKVAGRYLSGAVIPDAFSLLSQRPETLRFRESFKNAYGREPDQFAAYGHDAGQAILTALAAGARDRASFVRLWPTLIIPGAIGPFTFDSEGDLVLEPTLLTVDKTEFKLLREPGQPIK
ncbi:MAG: penicillin-binding protein activator [Deltaproteobacteria bacterium]|jgi:branched-chain amino acid transport system substrate-binding protein|nr:penicillin-binding protein activator [Deltaproteobacteria bacterium]